MVQGPVVGGGFLWSTEDTQVKSHFSTGYPFPWLRSSCPWETLETLSHAHHQAATTTL